MTRPREIIVVGAGPGGLTAALILAHRGFSVKVFERFDHVGGRTSEVRLGDYSFDLGPTFFMMKYLLDDIFEEAGRNTDDYFESMKLYPMYRLMFEDFSLNVSDDRARLKEELSKIFPGSEAGFDRFYKKENKRLEKIFPVLQNHYSTLSQFFRPDFILSIPYLGLGRTLMDNLGRYFGLEKMRLCFSFQSKYLGMSPWHCPAAYTILPLIEYRFGVFHVTGGLNMISRGIAKAAKEAGAEIHLGAPVKRLLVQGRTVRGVELEDSTKVEADEVIVNADFGYAMTKLVEPGVLKRWAPAKLAKKEFSCSTFMLYLGLDKLYDLPVHNIVFAKDYRTNIDDITERFKLSDEYSMYIRNSSILDKGIAPEGHSAVYVLVPVPNNRSKIDWPREIPAMREKTLDLIAARTPMKDIRGHIREELIITPADWENNYNIFLGATFNLGHGTSQVLYLRPRNRFEELDCCYLVGGGTHPGSGLPTIFESARISSNLICEKYGVPFNRPRPLPEN